MNLLDSIFDLNRRVSYNNPVWEKLRFNSAVRFAMRFIANNILPIVYEFSRPETIVEKLPIIVSLTSFPARIKKLHIVIESLLRQKAAPEKIILWLSKDQFPGEMSDVPKSLLMQQSRGLEIRFVDGDIRSHKKYYYVFREYPKKHVLTIDDDLLFPSTFIFDTYRVATDHPNSVVANFGSKISWNATLNCFEKKYERIPPCTTGKNLFFGSGGGTLFPPNRVNDYLDDIQVIMQLCPTADDIYLNAISRLAGLDITFREVLPLLSIENKNDEKLTDHNGNLYSPTSKNADQLRALVAYCVDKYGINPFALV